VRDVPVERVLIFSHIMMSYQYLNRKDREPYKRLALMTKYRKKHGKPRNI
jgi:hypothetical protein